VKIVGATFVYNDWEYLDQSLESFKWFPDKHFIIEGSWKSAQSTGGAKPRSNEITYEIINKHVDNKQVFLVQANAERERNQRQIALELAKKEGADWFFMTDADEVYVKNKLILIKNWLEKAKDSSALGFRVNSYNFINSFKKWYSGNYMRIYRVTKDARFFMDNDVEWPDRKGYIGTIPGVSYYHYNYVRRNTERFWTMMKYQNEQDPSFWQRYVDSGQYAEQAGKYKIPDDIKIYDYTGKHPLIMKNHPYFVQDVFGDGEIQYE